MRLVLTFILRLLVDSNQPKVLRGSLERVPEGDPHSFANAEALMALLECSTNLPDRPGEDFPGVETSPEIQDDLS